MIIKGMKVEPLVFEDMTSDLIRFADPYKRKSCHTVAMANLFFFTRYVKLLLLTFLRWFCFVLFFVYLGEGGYYLNIVSDTFNGGDGFSLGQGVTIWISSHIPSIEEMVLRGSIFLLTGVVSKCVRFLSGVVINTSSLLEAFSSLPGWTIEGLIPISFVTISIYEIEVVYIKTSENFTTYAKTKLYHFLRLDPSPKYHGRENMLQPQMD